MKIFKFYPVNAETGISVAIEKSPGGPSKPNLPGMQEIFDIHFGYTYAHVDDSAVADPDNYIFEITEGQLASDIQDKVNNLLESWKEQVYKNEKELRQQVFGKYDETATSSGIYKYQEALNYINDATPSAVLTAEATERGVTVDEIATRIVENHEAFRVKEAKIAGLRGKILDRLNAYTFDAADALGSWDELTKRTEVIGQREPSNNPLQNEDLDVKVNYYSPELSTRWQYMN